MEQPNLVTEARWEAIQPPQSIAEEQHGSSLRAVGRQEATQLPIHRLVFMNLDRRVERRARFDQMMEANGLSQIAARFPAVDGSRLDLDTYPRSIVAEEGVQCAQNPPAVVNGGSLTRGALGLILSYHTILKRIAADPDEDHVHVICEDDAVFVDNFVGRMQESLDAVNQLDPRWDFLHIGYYDDDCRLKPLEGPYNHLLCEPLTVYGLFGSALRPAGARALLEHLFPLNEQIDSALSRVYGTVRAYATRPSLMNAAHSEPGNTDIQILPEGFKFFSIR